MILELSLCVITTKSKNVRLHIEIKTKFSITEKLFEIILENSYSGTNLTKKYWLDHVRGN